MEQTGGILAVSHASTNSIVLFNKLTGTSLGTLTDATHLTNPGSLAFAPVVGGKQDLWVVSGASVLHYINTGTDAAPTYTYNSSIGGFSAALAVAINPVNTTTGEIVVADGGVDQQIKAFNFTGGSLWTYGQAGGYYNYSGSVPSPSVTNSKLYLDSTLGFGGNITNHYTNMTYLAFQPDGNSLWVGDDGDSRSLHQTDSGTSATYSDQISYLGSFYNTAVDPVANSDGTLRVFADFLEYKFNPNVAAAIQEIPTPAVAMAVGRWWIIGTLVCGRT